MSSEIPRDLEFVDPPEQTLFDAQELARKLELLGRGDEVHHIPSQVSALYAYFTLTKSQGGWTSEQKDSFVRLFSSLKSKIIDSEEQKFKEQN